MPEVQSAPVSGEMSQRFITFVMMQAQQISLCLGEIPHPQTGKPTPNLDAARLLIDQLEMIREKTRGNLTREEEEILGSVLADMQLAFVKAKTVTAAASSSSSQEEPTSAGSGNAESEGESKTRFHKSYG